MLADKLHNLMSIEIDLAKDVRSGTTFTPIVIRFSGITTP